MQLDRVAKEMVLDENLPTALLTQRPAMLGELRARVRARKKLDGLTVPYTFMGAADH